MPLFQRFPMMTDDQLLADQILLRPEDFGATPGINPNAPRRPTPLPSVLPRPDAKRNAPVSTGGFARADRSAGGPSIADVIMSRIGKLGSFGQGVNRVLNPIADFGADIGAAGRRAARSGGLAGIAPNFTRGVMTADQNELNRRLIESTIGLNTAKSFSELVGDPADLPEPKTDIGKAVADHNAGFTTDEQFAEQVASATRGNRRAALQATTELRKEHTSQTQGLSDGLTDLAKARALLESGNPVGATAAFTSFIRSIDNSVVRPAEQAAYSSAGGLAIRLQDEISKLTGEGPLSPTTQRNLLSSIDALDREYRAIIGRTDDFYRGLATSAELDPEQVVGKPKPERRDVQIDDRFDSPEDELRSLLDQTSAIERRIAELEQRGN